MNRKKKEKRQFERVLFSLEENVSGVFSLLWKGREFSSFIASILNISPGGLQFALKRDDDKRVKVGDRLLIKKIKGKEKLTFLVDIDLEIKWIVNIQYLEHIGIGCEFQNLSGVIRENIVQFVDSEIES